MITLGKIHTLRIARLTEIGAFLDAGPMGEILLPNRWLTEEMTEESTVDVFLYLDNEERPIATTEQPKIQVGQFASLTVKNAHPGGAFLDWGLQYRDLFIPAAAQAVPMKEGLRYVVYAFVDEISGRIMASSYYRAFLNKETPEFEANAEIEFLPAEKHENGIYGIINGEYLGLIYQNEVFESIRIGVSRKAYIKQIREDGKVDVALQPQGYKQVIPQAAQELHQALLEHGGFLPLTDKSAPEVIYQTLGMSKKNFKKALGRLYKARLVDIEARGIRSKA